MEFARDRVLSCESVCRKGYMRLKYDIKGCKVGSKYDPNIYVVIVLTLIQLEDV